jgi:hypothetical protein
MTDRKQAGVRVYAATGRNGDTPQDRMRDGLELMFVDYERLAIHERTVAGKKGHIAEGTYRAWKHPIYGYRPDEAKEVRVIHEPEAMVVREIFRAIADEGVSMHEIARCLDAQGVPPPGARRTYPKGIGGGVQRAAQPLWTHAGIKGIITHPAYKGVTVLGRSSVDAETHKRRKLPSDEWVTLVPSVTPPIVSPDLWARAQQRYASSGAVARRNETRPYLLRGRIRCARCGRAMTPDTEHRGTTRVYRCSSRSNGPGPCGTPRANSTLIEEQAWFVAGRLLTEPDILTEHLRRQQANGPDPLLTDERQRVQGRLAEVHAEQRNLADGLAQAPYHAKTWELVQARITQLDQEDDRLRKLLAELDHRLQDQAAATQRVADLATYIESLDRNIATFDFAAKRPAIEAIGMTVHAYGVTPGHFEFAIDDDRLAGIVDTLSRMSFRPLAEVADEVAGRGAGFSW